MIITNPPLLPLDLLQNALPDCPFEIDLVYAKPQHHDNQFPNLYHPHARMFVHTRLAPILLHAARLAHMRHGWVLKFNDCYRPVEAQARMAGYGLPPELVMRPGRGPHPRGLAMDIEPLIGDDLVPMGTPFDFFADDLALNPAGRDWAIFGPPEMTAQIIRNRHALDAIMLDAAEASGDTLEPYPYEWWDYRFPLAMYEAYPAYAESDLPGCYNMTKQPTAPDTATLAHWDALKEQILYQFG